VSFTAEYFLRAVARATETGCGLALAHSHPRAAGWQDLSRDDHDAEAGHAAQAMTITGRPLLGLTYAGEDGAYSARFWARTAPAPTYRRGARTCGSSATGSRSPGTTGCAPRPDSGQLRPVPCPPGDRKLKLIWPGCTSGSSAPAASAPLSPRPWPESASRGSR
jgi:hypothetical protein